MSELTKWICQYNFSETDTNYDKMGNLVLEAYDSEGNIIDTYPEAESEIDEYFQRKYSRESELTGSELVAEEFDGNYDKAFKAIKEDMEP